MCRHIDAIGVEKSDSMHELPIQCGTLRQTILVRVPSDSLVSVGECPANKLTMLFATRGQGEFNHRLRASLLYFGHTTRMLV